jgi:NitT/TauT family transport system ATP-binding protein
MSASGVPGAVVRPRRPAEAEMEVDPAAPGYIQFTDVDFRFPGRAGASPLILHDFSLGIERGEFFCLLGPSGCGKTTVLNLLAGFESPSAGAISVDHRLVAGPNVERTVVFQGDDSLYTWLTAIENVEFGLRLAGVDARRRHATAAQYLDLVGLRGQGDKYPSQLSGGMKQRIQIARALVCESPILLMDEPFAALDAQTRSILQDELIDIWQTTGRTFLFITHDIAEAILLADRIGLMTSGPAARMKSIVPVGLPRPRRRGDPAFGALYEQINVLVRDEVGRPGGDHQWA